MTFVRDCCSGAVNGCRALSRTGPQRDQLFCDVIVAPVFQDLTYSSSSRCVMLPLAAELRSDEGRLPAAAARVKSGHSPTRAGRIWQSSTVSISRVVQQR